MRIILLYFQALSFCGIQQFFPIEKGILWQLYIKNLQYKHLQKYLWIARDKHYQFSHFFM